MSIAQKYKKLKRLRNSLRIILAMSFVLAFLLVILLLSSITNLFTFNPPSYISIFNLKEEPVFVNGVELKIFDSFTGETNRSFVYNLENSNSEVVQSLVVPAFDFSELYIFLNTDSKYCFFSADVTSIYYDLGSTPALTDVFFISETETDHVNISINLDEYIYLYPGRYGIDTLPHTLLDKRVIGVYPILCSDLKDEGKQIGVVNLYKNFEPQEQRDYYNTEVDRLNKELE